MLAARSVATHLRRLGLPEVLGTVELSILVQVAAWGSRVVGGCVFVGSVLREIVAADDHTTSSPGRKR